MVLRSPWHLCRISLSVGREWIWGSYGSRLYFFKGCLHTHRVQGLRERRKCRWSYVDSGWGLAVINAPDTCPSQIVRSCSTGVSIMAVIAAILSSFMWISSCGWLIDHLRFLPWLFFFFAISFPCGVSGHRPHRPLGRPWSWARCGLGSLVEKSHHRIAPKHLFKRFFFSAYWPDFGSSLRNVRFGLSIMTLRCRSYCSASLEDYCWFPFQPGLQSPFWSYCDLGPCYFWILDDNLGSPGWFLSRGGHHRWNYYRGSSDVIPVRTLNGIYAP